MQVGVLDATSIFDLSIRREVMQVIHLAAESGYRSRSSDWTAGWTVRVSNPCKCKRFLSSPKRLDQPWGPSTLLPRLRMGGAIPLFPLYAFVAWTRKTLRFV